MYAVERWKSRETERKFNHRVRERKRQAAEDETKQGLLLGLRPDLNQKCTPVVDVIKLFGGNLDFPKIKKLNIVCSNIETCSKM